MKNYAEMSDQQINADVTREIYMLNGWSLNSAATFFSCVMNGDEHHVHQVLDYCNNWAVAGPVMLENFISIDQHYNGSYARVFGYGDDGLISLQCLRNDILRAAMIVFLMMKDAEK